MSYGSSFLSRDEFPKDFKGKSLIITEKSFFLFCKFLNKEEGNARNVDVLSCYHSQAAGVAAGIVIHRVLLFSLVCFDNIAKRLEATNQH